MSSFNQQLSTPTKPVTPPTNVAPTEGGSSSCSKSLIFDYHLADLSEAQRQRAVLLLEELNPETAQQVLDEWNEAIGSNSIRKSRWGWLNNIIGKAHSTGQNFSI